MVAMVGVDANEAALDFAIATDIEPPQFSPLLLTVGEVWLWHTKSPLQVVKCRAMKSDREHVRHRRKYSEGQLPPTRIAEQIELDALESKNLILTAIKRNYTQPATSLLTVPGAS